MKLKKTLILTAIICIFSCVALAAESNALVGLPDVLWKNDGTKASIEELKIKYSGHRESYFWDAGETFDIYIDVIGNNASFDGKVMILHPGDVVITRVTTDLSIDHDASVFLANNTYNKSAEEVLAEHMSLVAAMNYSEYSDDYVDEKILDYALGGWSTESYAITQSPPSWQSHELTIYQVGSCSNHTKTNEIITKVSGKHIDESFNTSFLVHFLPNDTEVFNELPTLSSYKVSPQSTKENGNFSISGKINGNGNKITAVSVGVRNADNEALGGYWGHEKNLNVDTFDLSSLGKLKAGDKIGNTTLEPGEYIVQVYVTTDTGLTFEKEQKTTITVKEKAAEHPTLTNFKVSPSTAEEGEHFSLSGKINGNGNKITAVSVGVRNAANEELGGYWGEKKNISKSSFDLSSFGKLKAGEKIGNTALTPGDYIVQVYVITDSGLSFKKEHKTTITIEEKEPVVIGVPKWQDEKKEITSAEDDVYLYYHVDDGAKYVLLEYEGCDKNGEAFEKASMGAYPVKKRFGYVLSFRKEFPYGFNDKPFSQFTAPISKMYLTVCDENENPLSETSAPLCIYRTDLMEENGLAAPEWVHSSHDIYSSADAVDMLFRTEKGDYISLLFEEYNENGELINAEWDSTKYNAYKLDSKTFTLGEPFVGFTAPVTKVYMMVCDAAGNRLSDNSAPMTVNLKENINADGTCVNHDFSTSTVYDHTLFAEIAGDDQFHLGYADVFHMTCSVCGVEQTSENPRNPQLNIEHDYVNGVCQTEGCKHVCNHMYVNKGDSNGNPVLVSGSGVWESAGKAGHVCSSVTYVQQCAYCRMERNNTVSDPYYGEVQAHILNAENVYDWNDDEHWIAKVVESCSACAYSNVKDVAGKHEAHQDDANGKCVTCRSFSIPASTVTLSAINEEIDHLYKLATTAYNTALGSQYKNSFEEITTLLFAKGTGALSFEIKRLFTNDDIEKIVEMMILAEMDDVEYIANTCFSDYEEWCKQQGFGFDQFDKVIALVQKHGLEWDFNNGRWLDELGDRIATSESNEKIDEELEVFESMKQLYSYYQATNSGVRTVSSFTKFLKSLQTNGKNYEMRVYMQTSSKERLSALKNGFTDSRIIDAIEDYQWKIDHALAQWSLDTMFTTLKEGTKTYGSYCKLVEHLQKSKIIKHIPEHASKYLKATQKFKDYKVAGKFALKDINAGAKSFDTISGIINLFMDADGFTDHIAILEREALLLSAELEDKPVATSQSSKSALTTRICAVGALADVTYASINDLIKDCWNIYTTGTTGMLHMLFGDDTTLTDILDTENKIYLIKQELSSTITSLLEMIQKCPEIERHHGGSTRSF